MEKKVILLTGIPSSGKTIATEFIKENFASVKVIRYGELIFEVKKKAYPGLNYEQMRALSASIITRKDIETVDNLILEIVNKYRKKFNIVIESHGVTKEDYGFRVTPYKKLKDLHALGVNSVIYVYSHSNTVLQRMKKSPKGRKRVTSKQVEQNLQLQESLALLYATLTGSNLIVIDNNNSMLNFKRKIKLVFTKVLQN